MRFTANYGFKTFYSKLWNHNMPHSTIMDDDDRVFLDLKCLQMATIIRLAAQSSVFSCGTVFVCVLSARDVFCVCSFCKKQNS